MGLARAMFSRGMASYSLINDIVFKIVFGTETNRPLLRA